MKTFKLLSGVALLFVSFLMFCGTIVSTIQNMNPTDEDAGASADERRGYAIGVIIGFCILMTLTYFIAKFALKLIRNKPKPTSEIEQIGQ